MSTTINYYSRGERDGILDRLNVIGCKWKSGHKANDLSWSCGAIGGDEGSITVFGLQLICGNQHEYGITSREFLELPINYLLAKENNA